ncbi:MAG TPA: fibrobacter succinogenes major paralogous domain-containing protein [Flavobacteriales bacterium]|nr:fibrobacter succinogenes major paralogous domain-containing protein [Flavobacteriales bacterium]HMR25933.1 fibrobacter succinogenes major paralogous domain-containing protein [Flavobacteriales bacterium]
MTLRSALGVFSLALLAGSLHAQSVTLTFTAELNGGHIPLDSVRFINLTQGGDTVLHAPDTVLVLNNSMSIGASDLDVLTGLMLSTPRPNPFEEHTQLVVTVAGEGALELTVLDAVGKTVSDLRRRVGPGQHTFSFAGGPVGLLYAVARWNGERTVQRMVGLSSTSQPGVLHWAGSSPLPVGGPKSVSFPWQPGDTLRYLGYASDTIGPLSAFIEDDPTSSATELFQLARGLVCPDSPSMTDIDGNTYGTVQIGSQCWMAENLRTATYRDGSSIPNVTDNTAWTQLNSGAWCNHGNNAANDDIYGKLYNWYTVVDPSGLCPQGWHVPTDAEWQQLEAALGMPIIELDSIGPRGSGVGTLLKASTFYDIHPPGGTNETGFTGTGGGWRLDGTGIFVSLGYHGFWWTDTAIDPDLSWFRSLSVTYTAVGRDSWSKRLGFSVRCVRD